MGRGEGGFQVQFQSCTHQKRHASILTQLYQLAHRTGIPAQVRCNHNRGSRRHQRLPDLLHTSRAQSSWCHGLPLPCIDGVGLNALLQGFSACNQIRWALGLTSGDLCCSEDELLRILTRTNLVVVHCVLPHNTPLVAGVLEVVYEFLFSPINAMSSQRDD